MAKREIPEWIPGIIFDKAIRNLNEPSLNDENSLIFYCKSYLCYETPIKLEVIYGRGNPVDLNDLI